MTTPSLAFGPEAKTNQSDERKREMSEAFENEVESEVATFDIGKDVDLIQEGVLLPKEWYLLEIAKAPRQDPNKKMKAGGAGAEGAAYNIVLDLITVHEDIPEYNNVPFTLWLSLPALGDSDRKMRGGQTFEDFKLDQIVKVVRGFSGKEVTGAKISFHKGQRAYLYVDQEVMSEGPNKGKTVNTINLNVGIKPVS